jgi:hypothetical protein
MTQIKWLKEVGCRQFGECDRGALAMIAHIIKRIDVVNQCQPAAAANGQLRCGSVAWGTSGAFC